MPTLFIRSTFMFQLDPQDLLIFFILLLSRLVLNFFSLSFRVKCEWIFQPYWPFGPLYSTYRTINQVCNLYRIPWSDEDTIIRDFWISYSNKRKKWFYCVTVRMVCKRSTFVYICTRTCIFCIALQLQCMHIEGKGASTYTPTQLEALKTAFKCPKATSLIVSRIQ